ncbi:MAG: hypothetical protein M1835_005162 [Candelina submexicana]|nr:MAG: hypothetical protein M1835_005162 [Candelina submexicana]
MSLDEKSPSGARVIQSSTTDATTPQQPGRLEPPNVKTFGTLQTITDVSSTETLSPSTSQCLPPKEQYDPISSCPSSAFYCHPPTRTSFEQRKSESKAIIEVYDVDVEAGTPASKKTVGGRIKDCKKNSALCSKKQRRCHPMRNLTKKQKLWVQLLIALVIVATAVGIGVGISKAVGGGVVKGIDEQEAIGDKSH